MKLSIQWNSQWDTTLNATQKGPFESGSVSDVYLTSLPKRTTVKKWWTPVVGLTVCLFLPVANNVKLDDYLRLDNWRWDWCCCWLGSLWRGSCPCWWLCSWWCGHTRSFWLGHDWVTDLAISLSITAIRMITINNLCITTQYPEFSMPIPE